MIKIIGWSSHQSYKDRRPPWIRLHRNMLDNYEFHIMSVNARALLPMLWLLASEDEDPTSGMIQDDYKKIAFRLRCNEKEIRSAVEECSNSGFLQVIEKQPCIESVHESLRNRNQTVTPETETETETKSILSENKFLNNQFSEFWEIYGMKVGKDKSQKSYNKAIKSGVSHEVIISGVRRYQQHCQRNGIPPQYIKHPTTWLNGQHWNDQYPDATITTQKSNWDIEAERLLRKYEAEAQQTTIDVSSQSNLQTPKTIWELTR